MNHIDKVTTRVRPPQAGLPTATEPRHREPALPSPALSVISARSFERRESKFRVWRNFLSVKQYFTHIHRLNMELDLQSLFGFHVHSCANWQRLRNPPTPAFGLIYEGAVGQPR